jgi:hypothetical protein
MGAAEANRYRRSITLQDLIDYLTAHQLVPGTGIQFTPDGEYQQ